MSRRHLLTCLMLVLCCYGCQPEAPQPPPAAAPSSSAAPEKAAETTQKSADQEKPTDQQAAKQAPEKLKSDETAELKVAAAADLRFVFPELEKEFLKGHPHAVIKPTFGASGTLFAQITNHAPMDVFLSADVQYVQKLLDNESAVSDSLFRYAVGHIVLWVRKESPLKVEELGAKLLTDPEVKKVALANPATAPYGRAAEAALKKLELYDAIKEKLVLGENVAQTAQFAETGAADVGIIGLSFALAPAFADKGRYWKFPADSFPKIEQAGVILKSSQQQTLAKEFCDFLQSEPAQVIFKKYGFELPDAKSETK